MALHFALMFIGGTADEFIKQVKHADAAGFHRFWASDGEQSALLTIGLVSGHSQRIRLATGVAHAFTRTPLETAQIALNLSQFSNGRFALGLGPGSRQNVEAWHGVAYEHPAARMREYVQVTRALLEALPGGGQVEHRGRFYNVLYDRKRVGLPQEAPPPIFMGTLGPLMSRVAGEVADGLLGNVLGSPFWLREVVWPNIRRGMAAARRDGADFELTATLTCAISSDRKQARRDVAKVLAWYGAQRSSEPTFERHGFGAVARQLQAARPEQAADLVTEEMIDCWAAAGSADEVRRAVSRYEGVAAGVRVIPPPHILPKEEALAYQWALLEAFGK